MPQANILPKKEEPFGSRSGDTRGRREMFPSAGHALVARAVAREGLRVQMTGATFGAASRLMDVTDRLRSQVTKVVHGSHGVRLLWSGAQRARCIPQGGEQGDADGHQERE